MEKDKAHYKKRKGKGKIVLKIEKKEKMNENVNKM